MCTKHFSELMLRPKTFFLIRTVSLVDVYDMHQISFWMPTYLTKDKELPETPLTGLAGEETDITMIKQSNV